MLSFNEMGLSPAIIKGVEELGFENPTPIQQKVIPTFLGNENDIVGLAQTGTGKTAAFGLPIIEQIDLKNKSVQALVLAPTRELCMQISRDLQEYSRYVKGVKVVPVYGGASIDTQIRALKKGAQIVVATPGRMLDLLKRRAANISNLQIAVLDEADEMLNMGFRDELDGILETTPKNKRTLLFSATMPREVARIAKNYMRDPIQITIGKQNAGAENVRHIYYQVHARDRYLALKRIADINPDIYGIVFCRTRTETKEVADKLIKDGYNADAIHGDLSQSQRDYVMKKFREKSLQMLVATDVAARGIDVNDITHVINYNLPDELEIYTHRSGRTGRAGKSGISIAIVNYREKSRIPMIEKIIGKKFEQKPVPSGDEICKKQLFKLIDRMEKVNVDEKQIEPFMDKVNKKLEWLSKEEIIKHFVSLEFNRFLEYYKNAPDLNVSAENRRGKNDSSNRVSSRGEKGVRSSRRGSRNSGDFTRLFINIGRKDGIMPQKLIGLVNDKLNNRDINIGDIEIKDSFTFFEVGERFAENVVKTFNRSKYKGREIRIEPAEKSTGKKKKKSGRKRREKR
jgi:ATP-dependent RNA helicase DeaD